MAACVQHPENLGGGPHKPSRPRMLHMLSLEGKADALGGESRNFPEHHLCESVLTVGAWATASLM